jgi:hypothetical protein
MCLGFSLISQYNTFDCKSIAASLQRLIVVSWNCPFVSLISPTFLNNVHWDLHRKGPIFFPRFRQVPFHKYTLILDLRNSDYGERNRSPLKTDFRYVQVLLKTGCTVQPFMWHIASGQTTMYSVQRETWRIKMRRIFKMNWKQLFVFLCRMVYAEVRSTICTVVAVTTVPCDRDE